MTYDVCDDILNKHREDFYKSIEILPKEIYHYTSSTALLSIIKNKELWFTNSRFLNDKTENRYIYLLINEYIEQNKNKFREEYYKEIKHLCYILTKDENEFCYNLFNENQLYVSSFSLNQDSLGLWNYYTKSSESTGYNIIFDTEKFFKYSNDGSLIKQYGKVIYDKKEQLTILNSLITNLYQRFEELGDNSTEQNMLFQDFACLVSEFSIFFKDISFKQEEEFRFVWESSKNANIREYKNIFIPYLKYSIPVVSILGITISPTNQSNIVKLGLQQLIQNYLYETERNVTYRIDESNIPLRY